MIDIFCALASGDNMDESRSLRSNVQMRREVGWVKGTHRRSRAHCTIGIGTTSGVSAAPNILAVIHKSCDPESTLQGNVAGV